MDHVVVAPATAPTNNFWNGFYAGGSLGMGSTNYKFSGGLANAGGPIAGLTLPDLGGSGPLFTLQAGYNWRANPNLVVGVQLDGSITTIKNTANGFITGLGTATYEIKPRSEIALTARLGYVVQERTMLYGLAVVSRAKFAGALNVNNAGGANVFSSNYSFDRTGLTIGVGIATMLRYNVSVGLEYRYTDYGRETIFNGPIGGGATLDAGFTTKMQTVRASMNYRF